MQIGKRSYLVGFLLASTVVACSSGDTPPPAEQPGAVTYWQNVAPIAQKRCVSCHQKDGIGPFRMDSYADAKPKAALIAGAVKTRAMPPWLAQGDGTCGDFKGSNWLTDDEITTLNKWAETGAIEGTPRVDLQVPPVGKLDATVEIATPEFHPKARGDATAHADDYRCFAVDAKQPTVQFMTGYEVVPGNPAMIHHVLLMQVDPEKKLEDGRTNGEVMAALHAADPDRDGWPCYGLAGEKVAISGIPVTWAPGMGVVHLPPGVGVEISPKTQLVMQVHYNLADSSLIGRPDITKVRMELAPSVERPGFFDDQDKMLQTLYTATPATLAGGQKNVEYTYEVEYDGLLSALGTTTLDVFGVFPHMHGFGRTEKIEILKAGGATECAVHIPAWDFNWQLYYFYNEPLKIQPGDKVRVTCGYDTSTRSDAVLPGWGTANEMCFLGLFLVPPARQ